MRLGRWNREQIDEMLAHASGLPDLSARMDFISRQFLGVPYTASTLIGSPHNPEVFVINLEGVDCFTFLDYVEAMRPSRSFRRFREHLKQVRYRSATVSYQTRRHFFTDWLSRRTVYDATRGIAGKRAVTVKKGLNEKDDGSSFLPGIRPVSRRITYIPAAETVRGPVLSRLRTGDYVGIYSETAGLDVSHVGVFIKYGEKQFFRHASLIEKKVVDQDFTGYISGKPGIVVLRAQEKNELRIANC